MLYTYIPSSVKVKTAKATAFILSLSPKNYLSKHSKKNNFQRSGVLQAIRLAAATLLYSVNPILAHGERWLVPRLIPVHEAHLSANVARKRPRRALRRQATPRLGSRMSLCQGFWSTTWNGHMWDLTVTAWSYIYIYVYLFIWRWICIHIYTLYNMIWVNNGKLWRKYPFQRVSRPYIVNPKFKPSSLEE